MYICFKVEDTVKSMLKCQLTGLLMLQSHLVLVLQLTT